MTSFLKHRTRAPIAALALALASACATSTPRLPGAAPADVPTRMRVQVGGQVSAVSLEQYVLGAALSEVSPVGEAAPVVARVFEVQAIIARTYAAAHVGRHASEGFDLCDKTHCQLYQPARLQTSRFAAVARAAVVATTGRILRHNGRPADAPFHADCGGRTSTAADAWGGPALPYLPSRPDDVPEGTHRSWQFAESEAQVTAILRGDPRTDPGGAVRSLTVIRADPSGRAAQVEIVGRQTRLVTGSVFRAVVSANRGDRSVMSTRFVISRTPTGYRLDGTGFGHGVGLCQVGAIARARRGDSVEAILGHYYPGAR